MQIQNFYSDWLPTPSGQLDSIVLSPHTLKSDNCSLTGMQTDDCRLRELKVTDDSDNDIRMTAVDSNAQSTCSLIKCYNWVRDQSNRKKTKIKCQKQNSG